MNADDIALVRASFEQLLPRGSEFVHTFYATLFAGSPHARQLFPADMQEQSAKFLAMLSSIVDGLDRPAQLHALFAGMGQRHAGYGVEEDDFDDVGAALLHCLRQALGARWTPELEDAWASVYGEIAEVMIAAGRAPEPG